MSALVDAQFSNQILMLHYDSLQALGLAYTQAISAGSAQLFESRMRTPFDYFSEGLGLPDIVRQGRPAFETYWVSLGVPPSEPFGFRFDSMQLRGAELHIDYPGSNGWAVVYWKATNVGAMRSYINFSRFTKLQLELKGDQGGKKLWVHVKDADYPDDQSPIIVQLTLDNNWKSYEIDLAKFEPNNLSRLHIVLGFLIDPAQHPLAFSLRNARYD